MRIVVYINDWNNVDKNIFRKQLKIYNCIADTFCIDNSVDEQNINEFLELVQNDDLDRCAYNINDEKLSLHASISQYLIPDNMLVLTNKVVISEESILEMEKVAECAERHMFVVPRTNDGEYNKYCGPEEYVDEEDRVNWNKNHLSRYSFIPCSFNDCIFIKGYRVMQHMYIDLSGSLSSGIDPSFNSIRFAFSAFSLLMFDYGFATVIANYAYAENTSSEIDKNEENIFNIKLKKILDASILNYRKYSVSPVELFGKCEGKVNRKRKIWYYVSHLSSDVNGSSVHAFGVLSGLINSLNKDEWEITVMATEAIIETHHIRERFDCKVSSTYSDSDIFDVGFAPCSVVDSIFVKHCYKLIIWPLDLIMLRSGYIFNGEISNGYEFNARMADGLIYFSESVRKDFEAYFNFVPEVKNIPSLVTSITPGIIESDGDDSCLREKIPFDNFYLVMGNQLLHKMVIPVVSVLASTKRNIVAIGGTSEYKRISNNIIMMKSGTLSNEFMDALYRKCKGLIYPSVYEGFGLPPVQALNLGKPVFAMDMDVNHELENLVPEFKGRIKYMKTLQDLPALIDDFENNGIEPIKLNAYSRSWDDVGKDCAKFIEKVIKVPMDVQKLSIRKMIDI